MCCLPLCRGTQQRALIWWDAREHCSMIIGMISWWPFILGDSEWSNQILWSGGYDFSSYERMATQTAYLSITFYISTNWEKRISSNLIKSILSNERFSVQIEVEILSKQIIKATINHRNAKVPMSFLPWLALSRGALLAFGWGKGTSWTNICLKLMDDFFQVLWFQKRMNWQFLMVGHFFWVCFVLWSLKLSPYFFRWLRRTGHPVSLSMRWTLFLWRSWISFGRHGWRGGTTYLWYLVVRKDQHSDMDVSENGGFPPFFIHFFLGVFHYKPSIWGLPYFFKHPHNGDKFWWYFFGEIKTQRHS